MCKFGSKEAMIKFQVLDAELCPILGKKTCEELGFIIRVNSVELPKEIFNGLFKKFRVFNGFGG